MEGNLILEETWNRHSLRGRDVQARDPKSDGDDDRPHHTPCHRLHYHSRPDHSRATSHSAWWGVRALDFLLWAVAEGGGSEDVVDKKILPLILRLLGWDSLLLAEGEGKMRSREFLLVSSSRAEWGLGRSLLCTFHVARGKQTEPQRANEISFVPTSELFNLFRQPVTSNYTN